MSENCNHSNNDGEVIIDVRICIKTMVIWKSSKASILRYARAR